MFVKRKIQYKKIKKNKKTTTEQLSFFLSNLVHTFFFFESGLIWQPMNRIMVVIYVIFISFFQKNKKGNSTR